MTILELAELAEPVAPRHRALRLADFLRTRISARWFFRLSLVGALAIALAVSLLFGGGGTHRAQVPGTVRTQPGEALLPPPPVEAQVLQDIAPADAKALNAQQPFVANAVDPALPFRFAGTPEARQRAVDCLAAAAWYEAGDDAVGERSVVQVVLNRARHPAFPGTVCGVVFQGSERNTGCQFTFTCDGSLVRMPGTAAWTRARAIAEAALNGQVDRSVGTATHYHTDWVVPYWRASLDKIAQVETHLFYRWRGYWGTRPAFNRKPGTDEPFELKLGVLSPAHFPVGAVLPDAGASAPAIAAVPAAAAPPPPALIIEGVREKSLRSAVVRGHTADQNQYFIQVDPATFPGNYATAAVALCKGKPRCLVLGWRDPTRMATTLPLAEGGAPRTDVPVYAQRYRRRSRAVELRPDRSQEQGAMPAR